ncbi:hypothetical protein FC86_GL000829 [Holzapfeliella floricola DSM 23037 = JCM 16512]|uniref:Uncharacterized protein n=2 Tax=Holzapfeliella TaxID=2767883 RepID=A0A0R2DI01_9LACO|nr:hypothetical protein FC86_GL000829 [Holzapfeliella floricola DSM 23037 = JCM 16512]
MMKKKYIGIAIGLATFMVALTVYINVFQNNAEASRSDHDFTVYQSGSITVREAVANTDNDYIKASAKVKPEYFELAQNISDDMHQKYPGYDFEVSIITGSSEKITKSQYPTQQFIYIDTKNALSKLLKDDKNNEHYLEFRQFIREKSTYLRQIPALGNVQNSADLIIAGNNLQLAGMLPFPSDKGTDLYLQYANNLDVQLYIANQPQK